MTFIIIENDVRDYAMIDIGEMDEEDTDVWGALDKAQPDMYEYIHEITDVFEDERSYANAEVIRTVEELLEFNARVPEDED